ncbi:hypothetical protein AB0P41_23080 [Streptomyces sp. NPDC079167]|uniref:hypothetical protein n=1 Tax=Streptomyces sp. NPDC079167 TaxID=3154513 RepID=UPI0034199DAF
MTQAYQHAVDAYGELSLIYLDGTSSHAVRRSALLEPGAAVRDSLLATATITLSAAAGPELDCGEPVVKSVSSRFGSPLYARIDLVPAPGFPVAAGMRSHRASLFLSHGPTAPVALAAGIHRRLSPRSTEQRSMEQRATAGRAHDGLPGAGTGVG